MKSNAASPVLFPFSGKNSSLRENIKRLSNAQGLDAVKYYNIVP